MSDSTLSNEAIVVERIFDAPVEVIWQMWTQPEHFKNWYGPEGFTVPVAEMDVRVGGKHRFCMARQDGSMKFWTTGEYTEVVPNERLVYTESMTDEQGKVMLPTTGETHDPNQPSTTLITILLESLDGRTKMVMTHAGVPSNDQGATEGWKQAFTRLANYAETILNSK